MKRDKGNKWQELVEFALIVPRFLVLPFGMVEFGRAWMTKTILTGAAREVLRVYAVIPNDNSVASSRAIGTLSSAGLDPYGGPSTCIRKIWSRALATTL